LERARPQAKGWVSTYSMKMPDMPIKKWNQLGTYRSFERSKVGWNMAILG